MTAEGSRESASEQLQLANEEPQASEQILRVGFPRIALSIACSAVFHAVRGRLYAEGLEPRTHEGLQHLWNVHLVKAGLYEPATSRLLSRLQKLREEADYAQAFVIDEPGAREEIQAARGLVERIRHELGT